MLPEGLDDRFRELRRRPTARAALRTDRERAVERLVFGTAPGLWVPEPPLSPARNAPPPRLVDAPAADDRLAGLDAGGRPVLVRPAFGLEGEAPRAVVAHASEESDTWVLHVRLLTWDGPRLEIVGFLTHADVSHVTWVDHDEDGRPVRFATAGVPYNDLGRGAEVAWCEWDGDRCTRVRRVVADERGREHEELRHGEYDGAGLAAVRTDRREIWNRARDGFDADPLPPEEALAAWVDAVAEATGALVRRLAVEDLVAVKVSPAYGSNEEPSLVAVRGAGSRDAVGAVWEPRHPLLPELDDAGLRAWRSLRQQEVHDEQPEAGLALMRRLAAQPWAADAVPLVYALSRDPWGVAEQVLGAERMPGAAAPAPAVARAPASRAELVDRLAAFGLPAAVADQAAWGLALLGGGNGASRLGGRPELPAGAPWPESEGRQLTHLATIDLAELPAVEGRDVLPADGALVFFADLTEDGDLWDPTVVGEDDRVSIVHAPAGAPTKQARPRRRTTVLRDRRIRFVPVLTLPESAAGLDADQAVAYDRLYMALLDLGHPPPHLLLGHPCVAQIDPRAPGQISVLHVGYDEALGFEFLDGGDLTFFGDAEDVRAGRWERLTVSPESA